jgi:O-antigen ligase
MMEFLSNHEILAIAAVVFVMALFWMMFAFPYYIPHFLILTYFFLPVTYNLLNIQALPLTTVFVALFGPIIFFHASRKNLGFFTPIAIYLAIVIVSSIINSVNLWEMKSTLITALVSTMCVIALENSHPDKLKQFFGVIIGWILINTIFSVLQLTLGGSFYLISAEDGTEIGYIQRGYGLIGMATQVGANYCLGVPLMCAWLLERYSLKMLFLFIFSYLGLILAFSRGAIIGTTCAILLLLYLYKRWRLLNICLIIAFIALIGFSSLMAFLPDKYSYFFKGEDASAASRLPFTVVGLRMFQVKPFLGFGSGGFYEYCTKYGSSLHVEAHNTYLQVLVEYGFLGLSAFLFCIFKSIKAYMRYIQDGGSNELRAVAAGFLCSLIAILINGFVHCFEWNITFWLPLLSGYIFYSLRNREVTLGQSENDSFPALQ